MKSNSKLDILAKRLKSVDRHLVHLLALRVKLSAEVAMIKIEEKSPLYRREVETARLNLVSEWAVEEGINPEFARATLYPVIGESCKNQMTIIDRLRLNGQAEKFTPEYAELQENLIRLTEAWASKYDESYSGGHPATQAINEFERSVIDQTISQMKDKTLCLDIGCATGREIRRLSKRFKTLQGFDISKAMIDVGGQKLVAEQIKNIKLDVHNVETRWPIESSTVSMIIMNGGTGSDVSNLQFVLNEMVRVLKPHGRLIISFYNKDAWTQRVFFPWPLGLTAGIDQDRNCLEVKVGNDYIPIFAKPYSLEEVKKVIPRQLCLLSWTTYPMLSSILPKEIIEETNPQGIVKKLDGILSDSDHELGTYIIVSGEKVA